MSEDVTRFRFSLSPARVAQIKKIARARGWEFTNPHKIASRVIDTVLAEAAEEAVIQEMTLLSAAEMRQLLRNMLTARARSKSEIERVVRWAEAQRAGETLLDGLLTKKFDVVVPTDDSEELIFKKLE